MFGQPEETPTDIVDKCVMEELNTLVRICDQFYQKKAYNVVYCTTIDFLKYTVLDLYLPYVRNHIILKTEQKKEKQDILAQILTKMLILLSPILPFNTEDAYQQIYWRPKL